jgi:hypothetical protein
MRKNLKKIPEAIRQRIEQFDQDDIVAATVKLLRPADFANYGHLKLELLDGRPNIPPPAVPSADAGKYSHANVSAWRRSAKTFR